MSTNYTHFDNLAFNKLFGRGPDNAEILIINSSGIFVGVSVSGALSVSKLTTGSGSAASAALTVGSAGLGFYRVTTKQLGVAVAGANVVTFSTAAVTIVRPLIAKGTTTNNAAAAGNIGEYIESSVTSATNIPSTTGQYGDLTTISLTAGDWDVTSHAIYTLNGATMDVGAAKLFISTGSAGNDTTGIAAGTTLTNVMPPTANSNTAAYIPSYRISLAATTTVRLKGRLEYTAGTPQYFCHLHARRMT